MLIADAALAVWDGVRNHFGFWQFFGRFLTILYAYKAYDMICFDFLLVTRTRFFQRYWPEVDVCESFHKYGFNLKSQIIRIIVYPFLCALIAWICTMSIKYKAMKRMVAFINVQRIMAQPYDKLQKTFKTVTARPDIPKLSDPEFDFSVFQVNESPVLYVKHKNPVKGVCVFVTGGGMLKYPKPSQAKGMITYARKLGRDMILPRNKLKFSKEIINERK